MDEFHSQRMCRVFHRIFLPIFRTSRQSPRRTTLCVALRPERCCLWFHSVFQTRDYEQINRSHRQATCRKADMLPSCCVRSISQIVDLITPVVLTHPKNVLALKWLSPAAGPPRPQRRAIAYSSTISSRSRGHEAQRRRDVLGCNPLLVSHEVVTDFRDF